MQNLRAKRVRSLSDHMRDVLNAFDALFGTSAAPSRLARRWATFFGLADVDAFLANGIVAAACHDWGKAEDGFQEMLARRGRQLLRHEQLSVLLMHHPSVWRWLGANARLDREVIAAAVLGHHLKARYECLGKPNAETDVLMRVRWDNRDFQEHLVQLSERIGLAAVVPQDVPKVWSYHGNGDVYSIRDAIAALRERLDAFERDLARDEQRRRLLWAVRSALIAADAAGSALIREKNSVRQSISDWIGSAFASDACLDGAAVDRKVIQPRVRKLKDENRWSGWNEFQTACANSSVVPPRALLLAPCASGKTLAAWRWIAARCAEVPRGRVIFLYPTRGTATEGYRIYVLYAGPEEAALVHGTADLDLDDVHRDLDSEKRIKDARLFALRNWPKRLFSATVDQFLGFLQHGYGPTCHLPLLADSVVVFDEVHSYDRGMFSALLEFLEHFDLPVLCMTATLLERRRNSLAKYLTVLDRLKGATGDLREIAGYRRYCVTLETDATAAEQRVKALLTEGNGKRVLWVVNTVDRAQDIARRFAVDPDAKKLETDGRVPVFCYHSRYKLADRKVWHDAVVDAFGPRNGQSHAVLAVTTQVCEMSLDLDADLLVTEYAPATSLVQRMGRCCRDRRAHATGRIGDVIVYEPESKRPYTDRNMVGAATFVANLAKENLLSQSRLETLLADVPQAADLPKACRFIESGPWAAMGEENFRDIDDYNRPCVLTTDADEYARLRDSKQRRDGERPWQADGLVLHVPKKFAKRDNRSDLPRWLYLTDARNYRPALGYYQPKNGGGG